MNFNSNAILSGNVDVIAMYNFVIVNTFDKFTINSVPVSYTHLDVYKRQLQRYQTVYDRTPREQVTPV